MIKIFKKITVTLKDDTDIIYTDAMIGEKLVFSYFDVTGTDENGKQNFTEFTYDEVKKIALEV